MSVDVEGGRLASRVTYLMTDIEGSTRRWEADPDHMAQLLEAHDTAIEAEVTKAGGELIKARGEGDSTFAVFPVAPAALHAALACQMRMLTEVGLPVRMAVHTADTNQRWGEYYGPPVNRAARLRSLAAGGASSCPRRRRRPFAPPCPRSATSSTWGSSSSRTWSDRSASSGCAIRHCQRSSRLATRYWVRTWWAAPAR